MALELLHHAGSLGKRPALMERLFTAYFAEGRHIGHLDELLTTATELDIDIVDARAALTERRHAAGVDADVVRAHACGATVVPFYVINDTWGLSGAQPVEQFLAVFNKTAQS